MRKSNSKSKKTYLLLVSNMGKMHSSDDDYSSESESEEEGPLSLNFDEYGATDEERDQVLGPFCRQMITFPSIKRYQRQVLDRKPFDFDSDFLKVFEHQLYHLYCRHTARHATIRLESSLTRNDQNALLGSWAAKMHTLLKSTPLYL